MIQGSIDTVLELFARIYERKIKDSESLAEYVTATWKDYNTLEVIGYPAHKAWVISIMVAEIRRTYPKEASNMTFLAEIAARGTKSKWDIITDRINWLAESRNPAGKLVYTAKQDNKNTTKNKPEDKAERTKPKGQDDTPSEKKSRKNNRPKNTTPCQVCGKIPYYWNAKKYNRGNGCYFCHKKAVDEILRQYDAQQQLDSSGAIASGLAQGKRSMAREIPQSAYTTDEWGGPALFPYRCISVRALPTSSAYDASKA